MKIFETFFVVIAQQYIKIWKKYHYWAVGVRYFMALILFFNVMSIIFITDYIPSKSAFILGGLVVYFYIQFYKTSINTKEYVEEYKVTKANKILVMSYVSISAIAAVALFLIKVVYK